MRATPGRTLLRRLEPNVTDCGLVIARIVQVGLATGSGSTGVGEIGEKQRGGAEGFVQGLGAGRVVVASTIR